ncbi:MAG: calcium/sodium antiporter [Pseudomonadota bacterium]
MQDVFLLIAGFAILLLAGDFLVRGAVSLAEQLGIPSLVIGLTIVAFGTSAPELVISLNAALNGFGGIAVGNVVGSNIANILVVLGMPALIKAIPCGGAGSSRSAVFMIVVTVVFMLSCFMQPIAFWNGVFLLALLILFLGDSVYYTKRQRAQGLEIEDPLDEVEGRTNNMWLAGGFLALGLIGLPIGGKFAIDGAVGIAQSLDVSETVIGLTIVAFGTSLPELVTALIAARKGHTELAMGNVIGSNVFNVLAIIGTTALITPLHTPERIYAFDLWVMAISSLALLPFVFMCKPISRPIGLAMILCYVTYLYAAFHFEA